MCIAIKFYSTPIPAHTGEENESSSDLNKCFLTKGGDINPTQEKYYKLYATSRQQNPIRGTLRIQLLLPKLQGKTPKTCVNGNDIMVYIDCQNLEQFFYEDAAKDSKTKNMLQIIKRIIYTITDFKKN